MLDLQPLVIQLGERVAIVGDVAEKLGPDAGRVEIMQADQLETAQDLTQILKFLGIWLWLLPIALWAVALWLARGRRRSILRTIAFGTILAGLLVLVLRRLGGSFIVDELVPSTAVQPAAHDAWDILTSQLRDGGFTFIGSASSCSSRSGWPAPHRAASPRGEGSRRISLAPRSPSASPAASSCCCSGGARPCRPRACL